MKTTLKFKFLKKKKKKKTLKFQHNHHRTIFLLKNKKQNDNNNHHRSASTENLSLIILCDFFFFLGRIFFVTWRLSGRLEQLKIFLPFLSITVVRNLLFHKFFFFLVCILMSIYLFIYFRCNV